MAEGIPSAFAVDLTRKWRALAERRKAYLVDLYHSGRWRLYYSEHEFVVRLREAIGVVEKWSATEQSMAREVAALPDSPVAADTGAVPRKAELLSGARLDGKACHNEAVSTLGKINATALTGAGSNGGAHHDEAQAEIEPAEDTLLERKRA